MLRLWARRTAVAGVGAASLAYASSPGFRRSVSFWSTVAPFVVEHYLIKLHGRWEGTEQSELDERLNAFHHRTAEQAVGIILRLGGIYVKIGQFASTMGAGILEDAYIRALQPLQDAVSVALAVGYQVARSAHTLLPVVIPETTCGRSSKETSLD